MYKVNSKSAEIKTYPLDLNQEQIKEIHEYNLAIAEMEMYKEVTHQKEKKLMTIKNNLEKCLPLLFYPEVIDIKNIYVPMTYCNGYQKSYNKMQSTKHDYNNKNNQKPKIKIDTAINDVNKLEERILEIQKNIKKGDEE